MRESTIDRFVIPVTSHLPDALQELENGRKQSHWMWFIFPQLRVLGRSETAVRYGLAGLEEARRLLDHPTLGPAYEQAVAAAHDAVIGRSLDIHQVFGSPDDLKLVSSLTLFEAVAQVDGRADLTERCGQLLSAAERQGISRCSTTLDEIKHTTR